MNKKQEYNRSPKENIQYFKLYSKLFTVEEYAVLSLEAKVLYSIMHARCELSAREGWLDDGKVYIFFTIEEIMKRLRCGSAKAVRILDELDTVRGIGLIERKKQGRGMPSKIFVLDIECKEFINKNFYDKNSSVKTLVKTKTETFQNETSGLFNNENQDFPKQKASNKENKYTENKYTEYSQSVNKESVYNKNNESTIDMTDKRQMYKNTIKANINYPVLKETCGTVWLNQIVELMVEIVCSDEKNIKIGSNFYPAEFVKERFWDLNENHIESVFYTTGASDKPVKNMRAYMRTALYQSVETADNVIKAKVKADMNRMSNNIKAV